MFKINLRQVRKTKKISQRVLAEMTGLSQQTISDIETGGNTNLATLAGIAKALGCQVTDLIEG